MATPKRTEFFTPWDAAKYLRSERDIAAYLATALEVAPNDAAFMAVVHEDIALARAALKRSPGQEEPPLIPREPVPRTA
jgi:DNA-binding phage protein